jgi:hypothetical protein
MIEATVMACNGVQTKADLVVHGFVLGSMDDLGILTVRFVVAEPGFFSSPVTGLFVDLMKMLAGLQQAKS